MLQLRQVPYKNASKKRIVGIKFAWEGVNAFNEKADMGSALKGYGGGFSDDELGPGRTESSKWGILSRDAKKITSVWVTEVAFSDGTKWAKN